MPLRLLVRAFVLAGPLVFGIEDTLERRDGRRIRVTGVDHDAVRSSRSHVVKATGLGGLSAMLLAPILLGLFSLVTLLATRLVHAGRLAVRSPAWYQKATPTFSDALAAVRAELWRHQSFHISRSRPDSPKAARRLLTRLTTILCEAP